MAEDVVEVGCAAAAVAVAVVEAFWSYEIRFSLSLLKRRNSWKLRYVDRNFWRFETVVLFMKFA